jgi:menaquinol-cytochrome c reductase iron-sulfur subunit
MGKWLLAGGGALTVGYFALGREGPIDEWVSVGNVQDLPVEKFETRQVYVTAHGTWFNKKVERTVWMCRHADESVTVLSAICPHLNYTINYWQQDLGIFKCPGHKSAFDSTGKVLEGPSPRPMDPLEHQVKDGRVMVRYQKFKKNLPTREVYT